MYLSRFKTKTSESTKYTQKNNLHTITPLLPQKGKLSSHSVDYAYIEKGYLTASKGLKLQLKCTWKEKLQTLLRPMCNRNWKNSKWSLLAYGEGNVNKIASPQSRVFFVGNTCKVLYKFSYRSESRRICEPAEEPSVSTEALTLAIKYKGKVFHLAGKLTLRRVFLSCYRPCFYYQNKYKLKSQQHSSHHIQDYRRQWVQNKTRACKHLANNAKQNSLKMKGTEGAYWLFWFFF